LLQQQQQQQQQQQSTEWLKRISVDTP
jgi:hypothetical protein